MKIINYLVVYGILVGTTISEISIISLQMPIDILNPLLIGLAGIKAILVALFFQHLKDEPKSLSSMLIFALILSIFLIGMIILEVVV